MIFPVILLAIGIFYIYAKIGLLDTTLGLVLAHSSLAVPIVLILMLASLKNFDFNQEKAARVLVATRFKAFCPVPFPQIRLAPFGAGLFAFLIWFDGMVIAIFISGNPTTQLTKPQKGSA